MSLDSSLSIAASGLQNINRHLAVVSQNVANVGTPGYARQVLAQTSLAADGLGMGVRSGVATREIDLRLQEASLRQGGTVAGLAARQAALVPVEAALGSPGQGDDLPALLGRLETGFSALATDPASQPAQASVVEAARGLARQVNALHTAYGTARQGAQDAVVAGVATLNRTLETIGGLSTRIVQARSLGQSTADLENQRDAAKAALSQLVEARFMEQPNGDVLVATVSGLSLPTRFDSDPFAVAAARVDAGMFYPGGGMPAVTLGGTDVSTRLGTGSLAANIGLRDAVLPGFQAGLDEFARTLSARFEAQGLRLFTDPAGTVPAAGGTPAQAGYVGYAGVLTVNPAVVADSTLVRDGTHAVLGSATGATAFTPNPAGGPAGFTTLAQRVLDHAFSREIQPGVAQPAPATSGLGPGGTLATPYAAVRDLPGLATALVAAQSREIGTTAEALDSARALQTTLDDRLANASAVSIDDEMTRMLQLQGAYAANARIIAAVQTMMDQTLQMLR